MAYNQYQNVSQNRSDRQFTQYINNLNSVASTILYYPLLVALPIGVLGNVLSFYIYTRPNLNKKTNTGFLYAWLCLLNLIFMLFFVLVSQSFTLFDYRISLPCGVANYLLRLISCFVPWMQVIISFDRFISVIYPLKKHIITKKRFLYLIMFGTLALLAVANMPNLLTFSQNFSRRPNSTDIRCTITNEVTVASNILAILFRAYIPFIIMLVLDVIVFKRIRKSKHRVGVIQIGDQIQKKQPGQISNKEYNFIISTIIIDLMFVFFYTPSAAYSSITVADVYISWDRLTSAAINVYNSCALLLAYLYSVVLLFIFFILNRFFRNEIYSLLRLNKIFPSLNQSLMETGLTIHRNNN